MEAFILVPTPERIRAVNASATQTQRAARAEDEAAVQSLRGDRSNQAADVAAALEDGRVTTEEQEALFARYGAMWAFDADGNRLEVMP
jgi:hypothetical protein